MDIALTLDGSPLLHMLREIAWVRTMTFEVPDDPHVGVSPQTLVELHHKVCTMVANCTPDEKYGIND